MIDDSPFCTVETRLGHLRVLSGSIHEREEREHRCDYCHSSNSDACIAVHGLSQREQQCAMW